MALASGEVVVATPSVGRGMTITLVEIKSIVNDLMIIVALLRASVASDTSSVQQILLFRLLTYARFRRWRYFHSCVQGAGSIL